MSKPLSPKAYANTLAKAWGKHFPVDVRVIALEYSAHQPDPIKKIEAINLPLDACEGLLAPNTRGTRWGIGYSTHIRENGKIAFTIAHELGHYLLHRKPALDTEEALRDFARRDERSMNIEQQANEFASYLLMPLNDFREQVGGDPITMDLVTHCATRYGASLTAAALKLIEFIDRRVVCVSSKDGIVQWSRSSYSAFKAGLYLRGGAAVPTSSLTFASQGAKSTSSQRTGAMNEHSGWFPGVHVHESVVPQPHYGSVFTLLQCWGSVGSPREEFDQEEPQEDTFDRFQSLSR